MVTVTNNAAKESNRVFVHVKAEQEIKSIRNEPLERLCTRKDRDYTHTFACSIRQSALSPEKQEHISSLPFVVVVVVVASICFPDPPAVRFISREADDVRMDWEGI